MAKLQPITMSQYVEETEGDAAAAFFVVNRTQTELVFSVTAGSKTQTVVVRETWIPQDLTIECPRAALINAPHLRQIVNSKKLSIVSAEVSRDKKEQGYIGANDVLETPRGKSALAALMQDQNISNTESLENGDIDLGMDLNMPTTKTKPSKGAEAEASISAFAASLIARESDAGEDTEGLVNALHNKASTLKAADFSYIAEQATTTAIKDAAASYITDASISI